MGLRDWFGRRERSKAAGDPVTFTPALVEALTLMDGSAIGYGTAYRKLQPVRTVVDFLANAVSDTPLKAYRRRSETDRPEERDHRAAQLLRRPNPSLTTQALTFGWIADLAVYGQAYTRFVPAAGRSPDQLIPIPPSRVTPKGGDLVAPSVFEVFPPDGAAPVRYSAEEILHFHLYDPEDRRVGASKLQALRNILQEEVEASRNRRGFWENSARVGGWYFPDEQLTDDQRTILLESMKGRLAGARNAGKIGVMPYPGKFQNDAFSPKDSEFIQGRLFVLEATARVFNLPLALLSLTETATYASQREFHKQLYMDVLPPWYKLITSELELQLLPWFTNTEDLYFEFKPDGKLWGDPIDRLDALNKAIGRPHMTVAEGRGLENLTDRGVETDDELVVPVGPNFALESLTGAVTEQPNLALVASMPEERLHRQIVEFFTHQERSVASKGTPFEHARWNRALTPLIGEDLAYRVNMDTAIELQHRDLHEVFAEAKHIRARSIVREVMEVKAG